MGGPQITPHVVAQKHLGPGESLFVAVSFPEGRYRVRAQGIDVQQAFRIERGGRAPCGSRWGRTRPRRTSRPWPRTGS